MESDVRMTLIDNGTRIKIEWLENDVVVKTEYSNNVGWIDTMKNVVTKS